MHNTCGTCKYWPQTGGRYRHCSWLVPLMPFWAKLDTSGSYDDDDCTEVNDGDGCDTWTLRGL